MKRCLVSISLLVLFGACHIAKIYDSDVSLAIYPYKSREWYDIQIPNKFLAAIELTVNFAFNNGAAREISERDLNHFHILVEGWNCTVEERGGLNNALLSFDAILFHAVGVSLLQPRNQITTKHPISLWTGQYCPPLEF